MHVTVLQEVGLKAKAVVQDLHPLRHVLPLPVLSDRLDNGADRQRDPLPEEPSIWLGAAAW